MVRSTDCRLAVGRVAAYLTIVGFALVARPVGASVVLLDEHWSPEIVQNEVTATEVDTEATGDPTQAMSGFFSARLENASGAPSVRFRNAASLRPTDLPPDETEGRLWYRTDKWNGKLAMEVWVYVHSAGRPVQMLAADLDGGDEDGRLIADDRWHQARGMLTKGADYDVAAAGTAPAAAYVWLRPVEGWDIAHRTYVDRIEAIVVSRPGRDQPMPAPARHVRPVPGAQSDGPGVIWLEGEDAVESTFPAASAFLPDNADDQRLVSNGAWLQPGAEGTKAAWSVSVAQTGEYALWARGFWFRGDFRWRVDGGEWRVSGSDRAVLNAAHYRELDAKAWGLPAATVGWTALGPVELSAGEHRLEIECMPGALGMAFDCWVLARDAFAMPAP